MAAGNSVTVIGNITRDPELRATASGAAVVGFGLAYSRRYQKDNEWQEETSFFDVTAWNDLATNIANSLGKGDRVVVTGRIEQRTWETDNGDKRSKVDLVAEDVGPSLRWATASVTKNPKKDSSGGSGNSGSNRSSRVPDEEPF
jgi:single-strand DNA-binding protein